jgi:VanZ family protein
MNYPLLQHASEPVQSSYTILCNLWITLSIATFAAYDIVLSYSSSPCYAADIPTYPFSLSMWLHISSYMGLTLILFSVLYQYRHEFTYRRTIILCHDIIILLICMWNILGIIILWLHYSDYVKCSIDMVTYMVIRLSAGIIINFLQLYMDYRQLQL